MRTKAAAARVEQYRELFIAGATPEEIAERMGVQARAVRLHLRGAGLLESPRIEGDEWAQIRAMLDDGVPSTWAAETFGRGAAAVRKKYRREAQASPPAGKEFREVWPRICLNDELYALHNEFAPKKRGH